tara:strand:- start:5682 stop:5975 length:294 start_codon:yes stop_codon:yes gene_type:complete
MTKQELIQEALDNLRDDRSATNKLLSDLKGEIVAQDATNAKAGIVAAKYVETLQRSNEQLVKIVALMERMNSQEEDISFDDKERDTLFEMIKKTAEK